MLNNINSRGLSKSKRSQSLTILMQQVTSQRRNWKQPSKKTPKLTHVHAGTNDLTNNINTLRSVKKYAKRQKRYLRIRRLSFRVLYSEKIGETLKNSALMSTPD